MYKTKNKNFLFSKGSLILTLLLSTNVMHADITVDGSLNDWDVLEQINLPQNLPPALSTEDAIYGKYIASSDSYAFAIKTKGTQIGQNTTFWLNTDNNVDTGFKVWGSYGGAEYFINIYSGDNKPYLYEGDGTYVTGPLEYSYSEDLTILEIKVPATYINSPQNDIGVIGDINDQIFFPQYYDLGQLTVSHEPLYLPERTDFSKRVGIVYSQTSKEHFYDANLSIQKAYSQIFMTMQYHSMMAGIPFDLLTEDDLADISKLVNYDVLIFPNFSYVPTENAQNIHQTLYNAIYHYGIGIITAGDWMTNLSDGSTIANDAYSNMKQMLGIGRVDGNGPVKITLKAQDTTHPAMQSYESGETILEYSNNHWYSYFAPVSNGIETQPISVLATQTITTEDNAVFNYNAVISTQTGGRNVHFSSLEFMGDSNMLWSALQWSIFGSQKPVALKMGRHNNLFVSRNDMDQSQEIDEVEANDGALLELLKLWKSQYNFVGSYYINIGNNPPEQTTDWNYSSILYRSYIDLGNEIGTHSYTHPHDTNLLTDDEIEFEFNNSMDIIASYLNPTWRYKNIRGGAVPGAPENVEVAENIMQYLDYLSGGYSGEGAGYPGAMGYLTPSASKVYLSPNMAFDFTLIEFGVPVWDEETKTYIPQPLSPEEAEQYWEDEYKTITNHASLPIIHWPWHDYGPTTGTTSGLYSLSMFTNTIYTAYQDNAEFLTGADLAERIEAFKNAKIDITKTDNIINVTVDSQNAGKFALEPTLDTDEKIQSVDNWYAYNDKKVFLDQDGGNFTIQTGSSTDPVTHITSLPMRANLLSLSGDGSNLSFSFEGEGVVNISLAKASYYYNISGADAIYTSERSRGCSRSRTSRRRSTTTTQNIQLIFNNYGIHTITIEER